MEARKSGSPCIFIHIHFTLCWTPFFMIFFKFYFSMLIAQFIGNIRFAKFTPKFRKKYKKWKYFNFEYRSRQIHWLGFALFNLWTLITNEFSNVWTCEGHLQIQNVTFTGTKAENSALLSELLFSSFVDFKAFFVL